MGVVYLMTYFRKFRSNRILNAVQHIDPVEKWPNGVMIVIAVCVEYIT